MEKTFFVVVRFLKEANKRGVLMVLVVPQDEISCTLVNNFRTSLVEFNCKWEASAFGDSLQMF